MTWKSFAIAPRKRLIATALMCRSLLDRSSDRFSAARREDANVGNSGCAMWHCVNVAAFRG